MILLPQKLTDALFHKNIKRACVVKTKVLLSNNVEEIKRLVVVNTGPEDQILYCLRATSKISYYKTNQFKKRNSVIIPAGDCLCFELETAIDVTYVYELEIHKMKERFNQIDFEFIGNLSPKIVEELNKIIASCPTIENNIKKKILPAG